MAVFRQVQVSYWQDPDILELSPEEKYFYLYLLTNSKTKQCGCYEISKHVMVLETGYDLEFVEKLIAKLIDIKKIEYCEETREILLLNWHKHNNSQSSKVKKCVANEVNRIKNSPFKQYCIETLLIDYPYSMETDQQKEEEKEEEKDEEKDDRSLSGLFPDDSIEMKMSKYMADRILEIYPKARVPESFTKWCQSFDRLMRIDGRTKDEIREVMEWIYQDDFWAVNIRSPEKLREKWDTVWLQMNRNRRQTGQQVKLKPGQLPGESDADYIGRLRLEQLRRVGLDEALDQGVSQ